MSNLDVAVTPELSDEALRLRNIAWHLQAKLAQLELEGTPAADRNTAAREAAEATEAAWQQIQRDQIRAEAEAQAAVAAMRLEAELGRALDDSVQLVVALLRREGPLSRSDIEARRLRGASKNALAAVLKEAARCGLATSQRAGRRVLWSAVPLSDIHSPE